MKPIKIIRSMILFLIALIIVVQLEWVPAKYVPDILEDASDAVMNIFERVGEYLVSEEENARNEVKDIVTEELENLAD